MQYTTRDQYEHISTTSNDPIVERRTCRISGKEFAIYASDDAFYQTIAPTFAGQKIAVPRPTLSRAKYARSLEEAKVAVTKQKEVIEKIEEFMEPLL